MVCDKVSDSSFLALPIPENKAEMLFFFRSSVSMLTSSKIAGGRVPTKLFSSITIL